MLKKSSKFFNYSNQVSSISNVILSRKTNIEALEAVLAEGRIAMEKGKSDVQKLKEALKKLNVLRKKEKEEASKVP